MKLKNNKGATLVELIVAMAVIAILMGQIGVLIYNTTNLYQRGTFEVDLQTESQQFVNQLQELLIDCDGFVSYNAATSASEDAMITISNSSNNVGEYTVQLTRDASSDMGGPVTLSWTGDSPFSDVLMADYVESVSLGTAEYESTSKVTIYVDMRNKRYTYSSATDLYLRNDIGLSNNNANKGDNSSYDYELDALRYATYDLDTLFGENGHTYTYSWKNDAAKAQLDYTLSGKNVSCTPALNTAFNKDPSGSSTTNPLSAGPWVIERIDTTSGDSKTIAVSTKKVSVGATGQPGDTKGYGLIFQSTYTTAQFDGYVPCFGVDLSKADSCEVSFICHMEFNHKFGDGGPNKSGSGADANHTVATKTYSAPLTDIIDVERIPSDSDWSNSPFKAVTENIYNNDNSKKYVMQNMGGFVPRIDKASNSMCYMNKYQFTGPSSDYYDFLGNGGVIIGKSVFNFGSNSVTLYGFMYPQKKGSGGGPSGPTKNDNCPDCGWVTNIPWNGSNWECPSCGKDLGSDVPTKGAACGTSGCPNEYYGQLEWNGSAYECPHCHVVEGSGGGGGDITPAQRAKFYQTINSFM